MRITRPLVWALALLVTGLPVRAQAPRLQILNRLKDGVTVSGAVTVKVSSDPILRPRGIKVGIEVDGELKATADELPWNYVWDSGNAPDGKHLIRLVLVNTRTNETGIVEEMRFQTSNRVVRSSQPAPQETKAAPQEQRPLDQKPEVRPHEAKQRDERPREEASRAARQDTPQEAESRRPEPSHRVVEGGTIVVTEYEADATRASDALTFSATSLQVEAGKLLIGRRDSSLTVFDPASRDGWSVRAPVPAGEVIAAARAGEIACWLCADAGAETSSRFAGSAPARWLFTYNEKEKRVRSHDLSGAPVVARRLALWRGNIVLTGPSGGAVMDVKRGMLRELETSLGDDVPSLRGSEVYFSAAGTRAVVVAMRRGGQSIATRRGPSAVPPSRGGEISAWASAGDRWAAIELPSLSEAGLDNARLLSMGTDWIGFVSGSTVASCSLASTLPEVQRADFPKSDQRNRTLIDSALSGSQLWCVRGNTLFHADMETGKRDAFLPWNVTGLVTRLIAAEGETLWLATNQGIKRLDLSQPDPEIGYAGFMRARLGSDQDRPTSDSAQRLTEEIDSWQGTPYVWGGETRNGVDCSGFVMKAFQGVGIGLSHGSDYLRTCSKGALVKDDLVYGDVLVFPGHCAIYTGDGTTAETVDKQVSRATIWRRTSVVVRRFLGQPAIETHAFASRSGGYKPQVKTSSRTRKRKSS